MRAFTFIEVPPDRQCERLLVELDRDVSLKLSLGQVSLRTPSQDYVWQVGSPGEAATFFESLRSTIEQSYADRGYVDAH